MRAVHFGAGNIGRGFVGLLLHEGGYEVVFADVNAELIGAIAAADSYTVHEVGDGAKDTVVTGFRAINSATDEEALVAEIAAADVVTTAVGPTILRFVAPVIARGIAARPSDAAPLAVMACENAINATDLLAAEVRQAVGDTAWESLAGRAVFANTAVDRIVPGQPAGQGIDVTVETFFEWAIETPAFNGSLPSIPGAHFVEELAPYIERKLFTVNTGHASVAYFGARAGIGTIAEALAEPSIAAAVGAVLEETSALLVAKHGLDVDAQREYRETILRRFANVHLPDTVERVGRQPLRKLSRTERFIGPAAELAVRGMGHDALVAAIGAALEFDVSDDEQSVELQAKLHDLAAEAFVEEVTGLAPEHPLAPAVLAQVTARQATLS
ncbi:mannitol-1-phosphate 5-dehydrogenase [Plantibacter sp. LMC-P-059a]|uniref:mannitol-1-phosphate 5-dehydrogenase n=1 Tax=Plantibacter sp. LMC-P-059a TaxID=3040297 RepID=UPI00254ABF85|nr:mannitol-1-phosphate 5-dehydrogenase [Plantibacter sp. LMC-P-059a]